MSDSDSFSDTSGDVGSYDFEDGFLIEESEDDASSMAVSSGAEFDPTEELLADMTLEERELYRNPKPRNRRATIRFQVDYRSADAGHDADVEGLPSESEYTAEEDSSYSEFEPSDSEYSSSDDY
jgi:hypothetical protein